MFRVFYTPSFNSGWMSFSKRSGRNTPQCYTKPLDSLKNWNNRLFWVDERVFPTVVDWRTNAPKDGMPVEGTYSLEAVRMDEPAATDSSGVPSTIERSPLDIAHEAGASDQGNAAPEMPSSDDVPATAAPGAGQAEETATMDPLVALESRKRGRDGPDVNAPPPQSHCGRIMLIRDPQGAPMGEKSCCHTTGFGVYCCCVRRCSCGRK
nr:hypothetical protein [Tanacetum cinerariifolium]